MSELIYGIHPIQTLLRNSPDRIIGVYLIQGQLNKRLQVIFQQAKRFNIPIRYCKRNDLDCKVKCIAHQGVVAKIRKIYILTENDMLRLLLASCDKKNLLLLVLDGVTDPRNMGACLRCACAFGVDMVIAPRHHSVGLTAIVRKSASGAVDSIPFIRVVNLARTLKLLKKYDIWIVGTVLVTERSVFKASLSGRLALVMGSESVGIRYSTKKYCDELFNIPMSVSLISLNVSVATGICLFEILRRRIYNSI